MPNTTGTSYTDERYTNNNTSHGNNGFHDEYLDDKYAEYEAMFDPMLNDRQARRKRKPKPVHRPKKSQAEIIDELTDDFSELEGGFKTTYQPARYETEWLTNSLRSFYELGLIDDVLAQVKGGKEANVYLCTATPAFREANGEHLRHLAAKVYRPRKFRSLRNDVTYREGRVTLGSNGRPLKDTDKRMMRAIDKKTSTGAQATHTSWLMHEFTTLQTLHQAGADVPKPVASSENALLMGYVGDARRAAPTLNEVGLSPEEAPLLLDRVLYNVELMLSYNLIHGDLSAYNILYWDGAITLIDFPQVTDSLGNSQAHKILRRDVTRVCEYFARQGVPCDERHISSALWQNYAAKDPLDKAADDERAATRLFGEREE